MALWMVVMGCRGTAVKTGLACWKKVGDDQSLPVCLTGTSTSRSHHEAGKNACNMILGSTKTGKKLAVLLLSIIGRVYCSLKCYRVSL